MAYAKVWSYTPYSYGDELYHHGVKGQKWGKRNYQYEDGTLTAAGKARYSDGNGGVNKKGQKKEIKAYKKGLNSLDKERAKLTGHKLKLESKYKEKNKYDLQDTNKKIKENAEKTRRLINKVSKKYSIQADDKWRKTGEGKVKNAIMSSTFGMYYNIGHQASLNRKYKNIGATTNAKGKTVTNTSEDVLGTKYKVYLDKNKINKNSRTKAIYNG